MSQVDETLAFVKVISSALGATNRGVTFDLQGFAQTDTGLGEGASQQEVYSALGVLSRPLPPEGSLFAEAIAARTGDGLVPIAVRDLRLSRFVNPDGSSAPAEGQTMLVGYGGGFVSLDLTAGNVGSRRANRSVTYIPYDFDGDGVPQKAHAIIIDPTPGNSSIQLVHGDGVFVTLTEDTGHGPGILMAAGANTFFEMVNGQINMQATKIMLKGSVYLGAAADAGIVLGPLTPSPSVYVSPV